MKHALSITVSTLTFAVASGTAQAAPITSLPVGIAADASAANTTPVHYRYSHRHYRHYGYPATAPTGTIIELTGRGGVPTRNRPDKARLCAVRRRLSGPIGSKADTARNFLPSIAFI